MPVPGEVLELVGPLNAVEVRALGDIIAGDKEAARLETILTNMQRSVTQTQAEIAKLKTSRYTALADILRCRGKDPSGKTLAVRSSPGGDYVVEVRRA